jgi:tyrosine-specific transport protein
VLFQLYPLLDWYLGQIGGVSFASKSNSILTLLFLLSAGTLFGVGVGSADWTRLGASGSMHWGMVPSAIPTFLQLLVYGEIVPCVCELLQYRRRPIQIAILLGSFLTLGLQIGWAALGTALVPVGTANVLDPVTVLLATPGMVRIPLLSLAVTAILTTILGTYLALLSSYQDLARNRNGVAKTSTGTRRKHPWRERLLVASIITAPALAIASMSPTIFLRAIDFAGSYPVLMLWGVLPPIISLMQRYRGRGSDQGHDNLHKKGLGDVGFDAFLIMLSSISLALVAMNVKNDMAPLLSKVASLLS